MLFVWFVVFIGDLVDSHRCRTIRPVRILRSPIGATLVVVAAFGCLYQGDGFDDRYSVGCAQYFDLDTSRCRVRRG